MAFCQIERFLHVNLWYQHQMLKYQKDATSTSPVHNLIPCKIPKLIQTHLFFKENHFACRHHSEAYKGQILCTHKETAG